MNTEEIIDFLKEEYEKKYNVPNATDKELVEWLGELRDGAVHKEVCTTHRWWYDWFFIVKIGDKLIGYDWATTTGDMTPRECGWEFDFDTLREWKEEQTTITCYRPKVD